jgi:hypothetical protein
MDIRRLHELWGIAVAEGSVNSGGIEGGYAFSTPD